MDPKDCTDTFSMGRKLTPANRFATCDRGCQIILFDQYEITKHYNAVHPGQQRPSYPLPMITDDQARQLVGDVEFAEQRGRRAAAHQVMLGDQASRSRFDRGGANHNGADDEDEDEDGDEEAEAEAEGGEEGDEEGEGEEEGDDEDAEGDVAMEAEEEITLDEEDSFEQTVAELIRRYREYRRL